MWITKVEPFDFEQHVSKPTETRVHYDQLNMCIEHCVNDNLLK